MLSDSVHRQSRFVTEQVCLQTDDLTVVYVHMQTNTNGFDVLVNVTFPARGFACNRLVGLSWVVHDSGVAPNDFYFRINESGPFMMVHASAPNRLDIALMMYS